MAGMVFSAVFQESLSRVTSFFLGKREEEASQGNYIERLEMAISDLELALERSAKLPMTDVSLLSRRKVFKRAYIEGTDLLDKYKQQPAPVDQAVVLQQGVTRSSSPGRSTHHAGRSNSSILSLLFGLRKEKGLSCADVCRFELFAEHARDFVRDVESGCSLRHHTFCNPLVRHLLEGKTFRHEIVQGTQVHGFYLSSTCSEERGIEANLVYNYRDCEVPEKNFGTQLILRLSESTDIVGIAIKWLLLLTSKFKLAAESAIGGLTLLADLQDISHWHVPHGASIVQILADLSAQLGRPDPLCCKAHGHRPSANNVITPGLLHLLPEEVISFSFNCRISAIENSSRRVKRGIRRDWRLPLEVSVCIRPHFNFVLVDQHSHAIEIVGGNEKIRYVSIEEVAEMARSQAINCFLRQPELTSYEIRWVSGHGEAAFEVIKPIAEEEDVPKSSSRYNTRSNAKRRRL